jgi:hypothetical protein
MPGHLLAATKAQLTDTEGIEGNYSKSRTAFSSFTINFLVNTAGNAVVIKKEITEPTIYSPCRNR